MTKEDPGLPPEDTSESDTDYDRKIQKLADDWDRVLAKLGIPPYDPDAPTTLAEEGIILFSTEEEAREHLRKMDEERQERQKHLRKDNDQK